MTLFIIARAKQHPQALQWQSERLNNRDSV